MAHKYLLLIIEDEKNIGDFIEAVVTANGYRALRANNGDKGVSLCASCCPDLILLDLGLPDVDGIEVIHKIRSFSSIPIIVISARMEETEKVETLDAGADDYLTKPFGTPELLARMRTAFRHKEMLQQTEKRAPSYSRDGLVIDFEKRLVTLHGTAVHLTQNEYKLVSLLARQAGSVMTYDYLIDQIWGPYADSNNQILRVNMANIRKKLEKNPADPQYIFTEVGVGYRMLE